ncbi:MAG: TolC family protein [Candidatus Omnitrophica bacterium]|nr:TolC family protein [Candidatus Omnitrophota bacterium]
MRNTWVIGIVFLLICQPLWADEKLTWQDCLLQASLQHPDLLSAKEGIRQSKDIKKITASTLWPQASGNISVSQLKSDTSADMASKTTNYAYGVSGSQLIFDGFKTINNVKASGENVKASERNFQFVSSQVRLRLRTAFINLLKAQSLIQLTKDIYEIRKQSVELIVKYYNSGMENSGSLLTAQANLAQAQFEINQAQRGLEVAQRSLLKEIGAKTIESLQAQGDFDISTKYKDRPDFDILVDQHPQLLQLIAQKNAASFDVKAGQGNLWPAVSLVGGADHSDKNWPPKASSTNVGVELSWPFLDGGSRIAQLDQAKSLFKSLQDQQQSVRDTLEVSLEQAWSNLQDAIEQVDVQKKFLAADQERSRIAQQQYSIGLLTFNDWTIIEDNLVSSKKTFLNAQANALLAEANWIAAQGRTLEYAN